MGPCMARLGNDHLTVTREDLESIRDVAFEVRGTSRKKEELKRSEFEMGIDEYIAEVRSNKVNRN